MSDKNIVAAQKIAELARKRGGRVYYVGGLVRDRILGKENKDVDIEVHGLTASQLEEILSKVGVPSKMGASFGIYGLAHHDIDIALPQTRSGRGQKNPAAFADPFMGTKKAAERRDFTMNALMEDVLTGEILDYFGGIADAKAGILRHVKDETFAEDPLRVLRAAQLSARYGFIVAEETVKLCAKLDLSGLASERIFGELEKALLKAKKPSRFFAVLRQMQQLSCWFPEVEALIDVPQEPRFHPEGDVWVHTMQVLDRAADRREWAAYPQGFMMSALCHDFGKPATTDCVDGVIHALTHESAGVPVAETFLDRITQDRKLKKYVLNMVLLHMRPYGMYKQNASPKSMCRLFDAAECPEDLLLLDRADSGKNDPEAESYLQNALAWYRELLSRPMVTGSDLKAMGFRPGKEYGEALAYARKLHLAGLPRDEQLRQTAGFLRKLQKGL